MTCLSFLWNFLEVYLQKHTKKKEIHKKHIL